MKTNATSSWRTLASSMHVQDSQGLVPTFHLTMKEYEPKFSQTTPQLFGTWKYNTKWVHNKE